MPTFDFQCGKCKATFEFARPFGSDEYPTCPECGSKKTEKLIATPAVHFKGSGWYKTDSRATSPAPKKNEEKKAEAPATETKIGKKEGNPSTKQTQKQGGPAHHGG